MKQSECNLEPQEWWSWSPARRFRESEKLWAVYRATGGSLNPEPDSQSPFYVRQHRVRALLMGGQACILYDGAKFSRATDFVVLCEPQTSRACNAPFVSSMPNRCTSLI